MFVFCFFAAELHGKSRKKNPVDLALKLAVITVEEESDFTPVQVEYLCGAMSTFGLRFYNGLTCKSVLSENGPTGDIKSAYSLVFAQSHLICGK